MALEDTPASTHGASLELTPWGTRFTSRATETGYREWHIEQAVPFNRVGGWFGGVFVWSAIVVVLLALGVLLSWVPVILFIVLPICLGALLTTYRRSLRRWMEPTVMAANMVAGIVVVGMLTSVDAYHLQGSMTALVVASFYGFGVFRARPAQAVVGVTPYVLLEAIVLVRDRGAGRSTVAGFAFDLFGLVTAYLTGLLINLVLDASWRRSYRQERIIEAQKETITRERARSETLLKKELSHQVAERSRELGDALSRLEGTRPTALPVAGEVFHTRYRVVRALGEGGMGAVFEVERLTDAQHFAVKVLTGRIAGTAAARFAREAEIGARLQHPNLISIVDVGVRESGAPFLVMALVRGGSLEGRRARFGEVAWALPILKQIALGLSVLHEAGVVHRDLKPSNVLLDDSDPESVVAKISDFGISRFGRLDEAGTVDPEALTVGVSTPDLTGTGAILGTPAYMAPEAARGGRSVDAAADVFAFGILAYEVLTGRAPFSTHPVLLARAGRPLPAPAPIDDARAAPLRATVLACLAEDPRSRPSAPTICEALGAISC